MQRNCLDFVNFPCTRDCSTKQLNFWFRLRIEIPGIDLKRFYRTDAINEIENIRIKFYFHFIGLRIICYFLCNFHQKLVNMYIRHFVLLFPFLFLSAALVF